MIAISKDAVHSILDQGGHIVLANPDKSCTVPGWPDRPSSHDDVERWHDLFGLGSGQFVGLGG